MKTIGLLLFGFNAIFNITAAAENTTVEVFSLKEKVDRAIIKFEQTKRMHWSYQVSRYEDEEGDISSSIEQYSPQASEPWLLKKINGQLPTNKQNKKFSKKKQAQSKAITQQDNIQVQLRELIDLDSLSLVASDDQNIVMAFNVYIKKLGKDSFGKLRGQLTYQKEQQFIEKMSISNTAEFSPMLTANITDLAITFTFVHIDGSVLPKQNEMQMKGSFAYFTEINETSVDVYSDYLYQGE